MNSSSKNRRRPGKNVRIKGRMNIPGNKRKKDVQVKGGPDEKS